MESINTNTGPARQYASKATCGKRKMFVYEYMGCLYGIIFAGNPRLPFASKY